MGLINGALQVGRSALAAYQASLQVTGHNIANAGTPGYTRLSPRMSPQGALGSVLNGGGVALEQIRRNVDVALQNRLRAAISSNGQSRVAAEQLGRAESIFNELSEEDLGNRLTEFFNAFHQVSQTPEDLGVRQVAIETGAALAGELRRIHIGLSQHQQDLSGDLSAMGRQVNELAHQIAELNVQIVDAAATGADDASALRDRRDQTIKELAEFIDVQVREQESGSVNVYVGNEALVQLGSSRELAVTEEMVNGSLRTVLRFADNQKQLAPKGGQIAGLLQVRDRDLPEQLEQLDELAAGLIFEVNKLHAEGLGLAGLSSATSTNRLLDPTQPLNSADAGLPFRVQNGSMLLRVIDQQTGQMRTTQINVNLTGLGGGDMSLEDLAAAIDAVDGVSAEVTLEGRLRISGDGPDYAFAISQDSSNVMAALGINEFFTGTAAGDIGVSEVLRDRPELLGAALTNEAGDGSNASRIAQLQTEQADAFGGFSIADFHREMVGKLAARTASAKSSAEAATSIHDSLAAQREAVSGVSLDEEAINLMEGQRAFQSAARYVGVVNQLIGELMSLV